MKKFTILTLMSVSANLVFAEMENLAISKKHGVYHQGNVRKEDHKTEHKHVLNPTQEKEYLLNILQSKAVNAGFKFPQSKWDECGFDPSGNYSGIACARSRQISVILQEYLADFVYECVNAGLVSQGGSSAVDVHIVHDGILGDRNHSPRSMHAEARAIDIKAINVKLANGKSKSFVFQGTANRAFYQAFRTCWGKVIKRENGCPYYDNRVDRTGTIGWEDGDHQHHMHTSVPYCVSGRYGSYYYQR